MRLTREEFLKKQREITQTAVRAEAESIRRIRKITRELVIPLIRQYAEQGMITFPKEELSKQIDHIIREEGSKPVMAARKLQEDMEVSLAEKLGIKIERRTEPQENAKQKRLNAAKKPIGEIIVLPGQGWGYGASSKGLAGYYRDPQTGKIVWTDLPLEYQFRKRSDLSTQVWKAVEEQEQMVFDVIRGGRAAGWNVKDISGDLESFINYPDGGKKVVGRWMGMFPNTEEGRREAWKREYLAAHGGFQPGSDAAKALLRQADAQDWVRQKMAEITQRGTPRLPAAVKQYATRLGKAGLDYRATRIARTETTAMLADEQTEIAENSDICSGEMDFVLDRGRDHWNCNCEHYAEQNPWKVDDPDRPEIPVHPNCMCEWRPRLKTDEEIIAAFKEEMAQDLEAIEGTQEQRDLLERWTCPKCGYTAVENGKLRNAKHCPVCGASMEHEGAPDDDGGKKYTDEAFEQRFGKEFTQFYDKSMNYIDSNSPMPDNVKKELERYLEINGKTVDGFINEVNDFIKTGEVVRHDPLDRFLEKIDDFEKDSRIKTQFETGTSGGYLGADDRNFWERRLIGQASNYGEDPSQSDMTSYGIENVHRPVYAEVTKHNPLEGNAKTYGKGEIAWIFTDQAKKRASFTLDNSSCEGMGSFRNDAASIFSKPMIDARQNAQNFYQAQRHSNGYVEAQVWGGIDLRKGDVKAVVIEDSVFAEKENDTAFQRFIQVIKDNGVPVVKGSEWGKNANAKAIDIPTMVIYNNIRKGKNMRLLAKCGENNLIYDAGDSWYHSWLMDTEDGKEFYIPKYKSQEDPEKGIYAKPYYPLAACLKWGFEPVDVGYLNALSKGRLKGVEEYLKTHP